MSNLEIALKSKHCGGCRQTVDLKHVGEGEARCPVCGRAFLVNIPDPAVRPARKVINPLRRVA